MLLDAHTRPPESMKHLFKKWQKSTGQAINDSAEIIDFDRPAIETGSKVSKSIAFSKEQINRVTRDFLAGEEYHDGCVSSNDWFRYEIKALPGLFVYPSLLSHEVQIALLDKLLHRDLSNPSHNSNLHLHYDIPYPSNDSDDALNTSQGSFFRADQAVLLQPKDPLVHKPLAVKQMLERKLRWITLGGQYDWTAKVYPSETPPQFPLDIVHLLRGIFPHVDAQAAIVNFYTPGDTLSVHRDVSEECDRGLISVSIGCDGVFIIGNQDGSRSATLRLKSGDVVLMSGDSRYAWHAVPKILSDTCPSWLKPWPAMGADSPFENWRDWMANKRINLNVRQMRV